MEEKKPDDATEEEGNLISSGANGDIPAAGENRELEIESLSSFLPADGSETQAVPQPIWRHLAWLRDSPAKPLLMSL